MANPFESVYVYPRIQGGTRVEWRLRDTFNDAPTYTFQLQYSEAQTPTVDDWINVGSTADNVFYLLDPEQRVFNNFNWACYRVRLTTSLGTYYSLPQSSFGVLGRRWWRIAKEIIRKELVRLRVDEIGTEVYVLKRRTQGTLCSVCVDPMTKEITREDCDTCWGTGWEGGYYDPAECVWADITAPPVQNDLDGGQARGTTDDHRRVKARMINIPSLFTGDIIVEKFSDNRWFVKRYDPIVAVQNIPLIVDAELRLMEYSSVIYQFPLDLTGDNTDAAETLRESETSLNNQCRTGYVKTEPSECPNPDPNAT